MAQNASECSFWRGRALACHRIPDVIQGLMNGCAHKHAGKLLLALMLATTSVAAQGVQPESLRLALVGLGHPNAELFAQRLNNPADPSHVAGGRIVAAFAGEPSKDAKAKERIDAVTTHLRDKYGVQIAESLQDAIGEVDAVLMLGTELGNRLDHASTVIAAGKPLYLSAPAASNLSELVEILKLAEAAETPVFTASPLAWSSGVTELAAAAGGEPPGGILGSGSAPGHHQQSLMLGPGIPLIEAMTTLMGPGCESVSCVAAPPFATVVGVWPGGRMGTLVIRKSQGAVFKMSRFDGEPGSDQKLVADPTPLLREIIQFFQTGQPPVSRRHSLGIYAFAEAASQSQGNNGASVSISEVLEKSGAPAQWWAEKPTKPEAPSK
jgi:hypothetical protein